MGRVKQATIANLIEYLTQVMHDDAINLDITDDSDGTGERIIISRGNERNKVATVTIHRGTFTSNDTPAGDTTLYDQIRDQIRESLKFRMKNGVISPRTRDCIEGSIEAHVGVILNMMKRYDSQSEHCVDDYLNTLQLVDAYVSADNTNKVDRILSTNKSK